MESLQFWRSEVRCEEEGTEVRVSVGLVSSGGSRRNLLFASPSVSWLLLPFFVSLTHVCVCVCVCVCVYLLSCVQLFVTP